MVRAVRGDGTQPEAAMAHAITSIVRKMLEKEQIPAKVTAEDPPTLHFAVQGENAAWMCVARIDEERAILAFFSLLAKPVPEERRAAVSELFTRVNYTLPVGSFELDLDDGDARLRTSIDLEGETAATGIVRRLLYANVAAMDFYYPCIEGVLDGMSPTDALDRLDRAAS
jgi:hypothetical protein